ncbi:MAG: amylo-alpha-1,6-glucosidase [Actinomycetota bacterium]|nr:amylo-alpha-1,6-glucosidase [Actinomycetota bacterium]
MADDLSTPVTGSWRDRPGLQPWLDQLVTCVRAPALVLSDGDGQIHRGQATGWYVDDRRLLEHLVVRLDGHLPVGVGSHLRTAGDADFSAVARHLGDQAADPTVFVERRRQLEADTLVETLRVHSMARGPVTTTVHIEIGTDGSTMHAVKGGRTDGTSPVVEVRPDGLAWRSPELAVDLTAAPVPDTVGMGSMSWDLSLECGDAVEITVRAAFVPGVRAAGTFDAATVPPWRSPTVTSADPRLADLVAASLADLEGLLLRDGEDVFLAAGSPWFLTLFGRDSLVAARFLLPLGTELALGTLRTLARRQGTGYDPATEEEPGKILHEVRSESLGEGGTLLPAVYFGTVDATALFVILLGEAWRWGAPAQEVRDLLPAAQRCLEWLERSAGDEFIRYVDHTGAGLANQGWKDSHDSVQWRDGTLARAPIALCEVQAYAHQAAGLGADLLEAHGIGDPAHWRNWAGELAARFRSQFWTRDRRGRYPGIALDADGRLVDSATSNMGHLLGTGLLDAGESALVAERLGDPSMNSGFGVRTLTTDSPRYSRLSYHGGSVWPHDTMVTALGASRDGHADLAVSLTEGVVRAAPTFGLRLPELYGGDASADVPGPAAYPAACRPQAWSAAAAVAGLSVLLGLDADLPRGRAWVRSPVARPFGDLSVQGLTIGSGRLSVELPRTGDALVACDRTGLTVLTD